MKIVWRHLSRAFVGVAMLASVAHASGFGPEALPERAPGKFDRAAAAESQRALSAWLSKGRVAQGLAHPLAVDVTAADKRSIRDPQPEEWLIRVGVNKRVAVAVDFSDVDAGRLGSRSQLRPFGAIRGDGSGGYVWTARILSREATGVRLQFKDVWLPRGAQLYVYNSSGDAFGPYTGRGPVGTGEFWSNTVTGGDVIVQLHQTGTPRNAARFMIQAVSHIGPKLPLGTQREPNAFCSYNESCVQNAGCGTSSAVNAAKDAVALIVFTSGGFQYICSGGLVADTVSTSQIPYFLTANHCINKGNQASSVEAYFQFESACGSCNDSLNGLPRTLGSSIVKTNRTSDYSLLQLSQPAPAGSAFLGWSATAVASTNNTPLYRISHPAGAPQAYSEHAVSTSKPTCSGWPRGSWIYSRDVLGATEGGSSGSPVVNGSGQIVGQLSGACGTNVNVSCDAVNNGTVDGAFAAYFTAVAPFLNPGSGGGGCAAAGASCTANSDCCSNSCKGQPGNKTCR